MDEHLESRLREELHRTVDHLQVSPDLWQKIRRRHRREPRQRLLAVATSMALLVVVAVAALPVVRQASSRPDDIGPTGSTGPAVISTPGPTLDPDQLAPITAEPAGPVRVLAHGEIEGRPWMFTAFRTTDGRLAWGFPQPNRDTVGGGWTGGSINPLRDDPLSPSVQINIGTARNHPSFVYGPVVKEAAVVRVQTPDGKIREVPAVGQDAGLAANFYAAPIPTGVSVDGVRVTAHDARGRQVGQAWKEVNPAAVPTTTTTPAATPTTTTTAGEMLVPGDPVPPGDELSLAFRSATHPGVLLTANYLDDREWMFVFFQRDQMACIAWLHGLGGCWGETGSAAALDGLPIRIAGHGGDAEGSQMYGVVSKEVTRVRLDLPDAQGQTVELRPVGQELGLDVNFFGVMLPGGTSFKAARVTAYDAAGRRLGNDRAAG